LLITSELTNQSARKALFTCVVYTNYSVALEHLFTEIELDLSSVN